MNETLLHVLGIVDLDDNRAIFRLEEQRDRGLIEVSVVGENLVINDKQKVGEPITLGAGDHKLRVTRGELEFESDNFTLKRGDRIVLNVKLAEGQVQVVRDQSIIGKRDMPAASRLGRDPADETASGDRNRDAAMAVLALGGTVTLIRDSDGTELVTPEQLPDEAFHLAAVNFSATRAHVGNKDLRVLAGLSKLSSIILAGQRSQDRDLLTDAGLAYLRDVSSLRALGLSGCKNITDDGLKHLANLSELEGLSLNGTSITGSGLSHLENCHKLGDLVLTVCPVTDAGLSALPSLPNLTHLDIGWTSTTDESIKSLERFPKLRSVVLPFKRTTDEGIRHLSRLPSLEVLYVGSAQLTRDGWAHIGKLTRLKFLGVFESPVANDDLKSFALLSELETLQLYNTSITDEGLKHLTPLRALRDLRVDHTKATAEGVAKLKLALPECMITSDFTDEQARRRWTSCANVAVTLRRDEPNTREVAPCPNLHSQYAKRDDKAHHGGA